MEDLRLRCADMKAEVATAREQAAPLVARIKEPEEERTRVAGERDTFRSRAEEATVSAKAIAGQLGTEQGTHLLTKGALNEALKVAEASRVNALAWKKKCEGESRRPSPLFGLFSFALNRILLVLAQCWRRRSRGRLRPQS